PARYQRHDTARLTAVSRLPGVPWVLAVEYDERQIFAGAQRITAPTLIIAVLLLLAALVATWYGTRFVIRPLRQLTHAANAMSHGDYTARVHLPQDDEL